MVLHGLQSTNTFYEETETIQYQNVAQLNYVKSKKSYGGTADVSFRTNSSHNLSFTPNHMFFYTCIDNPLVLETYATNNHRFVNGTLPMQSAGFETMQD